MTKTKYERIQAQLDAECTQYTLCYRLMAVL